MPGRLTSVQVCELFTLRRDSPDKWTPEALATRFSIGVHDVRLLLRHAVLPIVVTSRDGETLGYWHADELQNRTDQLSSDDDPQSNATKR
jgi:hypothetical protein